MYFFTFNPISINIKRVAIIATVGILLVVVIILSLNCFLLVKKTHQMQDIQQNQKVNAKIVNFLDLFIKKVLSAEGEVSFEDRLKLENAVRDLDNDEVLNQWEKFVNSSTEDQVQREVKTLLQLLVGKINY